MPMIGNFEKYQEEYRKKAILSYPPQWITVGISGACNNRCKFCAYHSDAAEGKSNVYGIRYRLPFDDFKRIVDMAHGGGVPRVHICASGEPFMHSDIVKMIDYVIEVYGKVSLQTNFCKSLFDKGNYIEEILKRKDKITNITTDILSGDPKQHEMLKKGANYSDVMDTVEYISANSDIYFDIHLLLTKLNYQYIPNLVNDVYMRRIKGFVHIFNLFSYDFNEFTSSSVGYSSEDIEITKVLEASAALGEHLGVKVSVPLPQDKQVASCDVFWSRLQIWPVHGNELTRQNENLVPYACRAVVRGKLNSLGYIFDYKNIMECWNNDKIVKIRQDLLNGIYPDEECKHCYMCDGYKRAVHKRFDLLLGWETKDNGPVVNESVHNNSLIRHPKKNKLLCWIKKLSYKLIYSITKNDKYRIKYLRYKLLLQQTKQLQER